jgi:hypothetical protein
MPLVVISLLFADCVSSEKAPPNPAAAEPALSLEEIYDSGYLVTKPLNGTITVLGIAGRRGSREDAISEALADAAQKVALYHGVHGESAAILNQGSGNLDYFSDFDYRLNLLNSADQYIGDLVFDKEKDILEKDGSVLVRVQYTGVSDIPPYTTGLEDRVPRWVKNYAADVPGFLTAVGFSKNRGSFQKTYRASYENGLVSLLPGLSSRIGNEVIDVSGGKITQNVSTSSGFLENVMILEVWLDRKTNTVWTLLVAKQKS